jgi:hypothetical protein
MNQPAGGLRFPAYHTHLGRPVKLLPSPDGGLAMWDYDEETGGWEPANHLVDEVLFAVGGEVSGPMSKDRFIQKVEAERALYVEGEGPIFALYETVRAIEDASDEEGRDLTPTEAALVAGLRRKTYAMFEAELVRRGDPGADVEAAREAGQ